MKFRQVDPKVNFPDLERKLIEYWQENKILESYLSKNVDSDRKFSFIDGPITANNPMGVHHAWGRTYKDLWQRFFNMTGYKQRFQNGFDEQGLWVEVEVEKELGLKNKKEIENLVSGDVFASIARFVNLCKERVKKYSAVQTEQSKRLGYFMDWDRSYHTSSDQNNYAIWHYLKAVYEKGWLYKGRDSVPWCPRCGTAISQHEILTEEYQEITHKAVFVKYKISGTDEKLLVWTTTPWTLPSNVAVAVNPDFFYGLWQNSKTKEKIIFLRTDDIEEGNRDLREELFGSEANEWKCLKDYKGLDLVGKTYEGLFDSLPALKNVSHRIVAAKDLVIAAEGTGLVHIAPGAGEEDFQLARREKLPVIASIDEGAFYIDGFGSLTGKNAKDAPDLIIDLLKEKDALFKVENYRHRYPTCWRCKTELVWRVVDEWYIAVDKVDPKTKKSYREGMKEVIKPEKINWIPSWGYERELDWLNNLHDWLISKKRYWGLALPIWECEKCGNFEVVGSKSELEEKAVEGWKDFVGNSPHRPWVDQVKIKCSECQNVISRVADVGNPWLDAGIVPFSTLKYFEDKKYWQEWFPADFITESFPGQFKNWFYSLIAMSTGLENTGPFKVLLGHGAVRDEKGEEMHKSKGNSIEFNEAADTIGVDVMRWLYLRTNPEHNVNFGYHVADEVRRYFHLRLWNIYSFFVTYSLLAKWEPKSGNFDPEAVLDKWLLSRMTGSIEKIEQHLKKYNAHGAVELAETFVINDLSNWYVRRIRDRVGPTSPDGKDKSDAFQTLWIVLSTYVKVLAPMIPFISEEIYKNLTGEMSVHLTQWPKNNTELKDSVLEEEMTYAREIVEKGHSIRKTGNIKVRQPLSKITYKGKKLREEIEKLVSDELNVKEVAFDSKQKEALLLDTKITAELKTEGEVRDLIRAIQEKRKEAGVEFDSLVNVYLPSWPKKYEAQIKNETLAKELIEGASLKVEKG